LERQARVGLDLWPALTHAPGLGRYAREFVRALARFSEPPLLRLLDVGPGARVLGADLAHHPAGWTRVQADLPRAALTLLARIGLPAERLLGGCELFHRVLPGEPPLGAVPRVQVLSELPESGSSAERALTRALAGPVDVVVFSAAAAAAVQRRFGLAAERVHSLPVGCDHWLRDAPAREEPGEPPLVLALGRTDERRGPLNLLAAFERLRASGTAARLVWCGRPGDSACELRSALAGSPVGHDLRWIEDPRESELPALVASAAVLVHLNRAEWTPVTPLEGLASGAALVASPLPAFREALGDEALWIEGDPAALDPGVLAQALRAALESARDPAARARRRALASGYTWSRHAQLTVDLWGAILDRQALARSL